MSQKSTYVAPDGHDEHHGQLQSLVELRPAADLAKAVAVGEDLGRGLAELGSDLVVRRDTLPLGSGNLDGLAILAEDLVHPVALEAGDDAGESVSSSRLIATWPEDTYVNFLVVSTVLPLP